MKKLFFVLTVSVALFQLSSCAKKEGCTDPTALNYDSSAEDDNGTCTYKGSAIFWNDVASGLGNVAVQMADGTTGVITADYTSAPDCGESSCFTYTAEPGTYSFSAAEVGGTATWNGSVTITSNGCVSYRLY